jgi:hypothetical protein
MMTTQLDTMMLSAGIRFGIAMVQFNNDKLDDDDRVVWPVNGWIKRPKETEQSFHLFLCSK